MQRVILLLMFICSLAHGSTYIKGPALIEQITVTATAAGTTVLTKDSETVQRFTGVTTQTVQLPSGLTLPVGRYFYILNRSTGTVTVNDGSGALLVTMPSNSQRYVVSTSAASIAGAWDVSVVNVANTIGILPLANGGTNKAMTASAGSVAYSDADSFEFTAVGTTGDLLVSQGTGTPVFQSVSTILDGTYFKQNGNSFGTTGTLGTNDGQDLALETNNTSRLIIRSTGAFDWTVPAAVNGTIQLGTATTDTNDIRIARGSTGLTPFDGSPLKVSNTTAEAAARSQYGAEFVTLGQNTVATTTRYGGLIGIGQHTSAFNLTATDVGLVGVIGLSRNTGAAAASTTTNSAGGSFVVGNNSTNEVVTNAYGTRVGMDSSITNTTNGVTNLFGYYMRDQGAGSTFDGAAISGIPAAALRWGAYLNDPSNNYMNGSLLIGQKSSTVRTSNLATTSASLEISSTTGALLLSRMTTTQKNALTATAGMQVYDTTLGQFSFYNGSWQSFFTNPMTTGGDLIYGGASGVATRLANGTAGQFLASTGGTTAPIWNTIGASTPFTRFSFTQLSNPTSGVTTSFANGVQTVTFTGTGAFRITLNSLANHSNAYTLCRLNWTLGGTATRLDKFGAMINNDGIVAQSADQYITNVIYGTFTNGQTVTILPRATVTYVSSGHTFDSDFLVEYMSQ